MTLFYFINICIFEIMEKIKQRWGITSNLQLICIFLVFSINGSFATWIAKPLTQIIGLNYETTNPLLFWPVRIILVFLVYQITLPMIGFCFGQFSFFWKLTKKMMQRVGFKNLLSLF